MFAGPMPWLTTRHSVAHWYRVQIDFQGALDDFWKAPTPPDAGLLDAFRRVLAARCLIPGSFFNEAGLRLAVEAAIERLEATYARAARGVPRPSADIESPIAAAVSMR